MVTDMLGTGSRVRSHAGVMDVGARRMSNANHRGGHGLTRQANQKQVINVCLPGGLDFADSYGLCGISLIRELDLLGVGVNVFALGNIDHVNCPSDIAEIAHRPHQKSAGTVYMGYPSNVRKHPESTRHGPQMLCTMFESSKAPSDWLVPMQSMDAIITPSKFCHDVFRDCGVTTPISVIPLGISDVYAPHRRPQRTPLTFLAFLDRGPRKGGLVAQHAFMLAFGESTDYHLILKMRKPKVYINMLNKNMTMIQADYTEQEMYELYCLADVMIDPNKGEGFGLLGRQASCCGCVTLSTDWGGTHDDLHTWGWPLRYKLVPADWAGNKLLEGQDLGLWAELAPEDVADALRDVAQRRVEYQKEAFEKAQNVRSLYSWRAFAEGVLDVWESVR